MTNCPVKDQHFLAPRLGPWLLQTLQDMGMRVKRLHRHNTLSFISLMANGLSGRKHIFPAASNLAGTMALGRPIKQSFLQVVSTFIKKYLA